MDPLPAIGQICAREGLWLHVDAAASGVAAICPEFRHFQDGLAAADSYCANAHKWLLTNFDCDLFYVRDRESLVSALTILPDYPQHRVGVGRGHRLSDWQAPGRRFRALKLWFVLRCYGAQRLREMIRRHVEAAAWLVKAIEGSADLVLAAPAPLNLVCLRHVDGDDATQRVLDRVNRSGLAYLTSTRVADRLVIRVSIGQRDGPAACRGPVATSPGCRGRP